MHCVKPTEVSTGTFLQLVAMETSVTKMATRGGSNCVELLYKQKQ